MVNLDRFSWEVNIVGFDGRVIGRRSIPLYNKHISLNMNATNCSNSIRTILEIFKLNFLKLLLEIVATLEILNLCLLNSLSFLLIGLLLFFVHLEVFIIKFLRVEIHIRIRLIFSFLLRFLLIITLTFLGLFFNGLGLVLKNLGLLLFWAFISLSPFNLDEVRV